ncbi:hypothetical protein HK098_006959 [Nowakowskiella sp. JEL0407]|nr:hypothetical protein HK098_006959 [Nowakowskiella sp. JEL0407]
MDLISLISERKAIPIAGKAVVEDIVKDPELSYIDIYEILQNQLSQCQQFENEINSLNKTLDDKELALSKALKKLAEVDKSKESLRNELLQVQETNKKLQSKLAKIEGSTLGFEDKLRDLSFRLDENKLKVGDRKNTLGNLTNKITKPDPKLPFRETVTVATAAAGAAIVAFLFSLFGRT